MAISVKKKPCYFRKMKGGKSVFGYKRPAILKKETGYEKKG